MDYRTDLEKEAQELAEDFLDALATRSKISRMEYQRLVGRLRTLRVKIENKQYGCKSSRHSSTCNCV